MGYIALPKLGKFPGTDGSGTASDTEETDEAMELDDALEETANVCEEVEDCSELLEDEVSRMSCSSAAAWSALVETTGETEDIKQVCDAYVEEEQSCCI